MVVKAEEIQSLARAIGVIRQFGAERPQLRLSEVAAAANLNRATARRVLRTLMGLGYVAAEGQYFRLTPRVLELGYAYLASQPWWKEAQRIVEKYAELFDSPLAASVLDGAHTVYIASARPKRYEIFVRTVGTRLPTQVSAQGRAILANLPEAQKNEVIASLKYAPITRHSVMDEVTLRKELDLIAKQDFALVDQELELGLRTVAVPLRNRSGTVFAGLGVGVRDLTMDRQHVIEHYLPKVRQCASEICAGLAS
jgi:IclR family pca regulon transcriptional regulator